MQSKVISLGKPRPQTFHLWLNHGTGAVVLFHNSVAQLQRGMEGMLVHNANGAASLAWIVEQPENYKPFYGSLELSQ